MIYKVRIRVTVTDENQKKIIDLVEDKYINEEALAALKEEEE